MPSPRATRSRTPVLAFALALLAGAAAQADELARTIDADVAKLGKDGRVSILIRSVTTGETLYARDAATPRAPASTMKLATTGAALELLGADFQHETGLYAVGTLEADGTLRGDLLVRGSGDPSISRRFQIDDAPLLADWAAELEKKVKRITGDVIADDRAFERLGFHPDWNPSEAQDWYAAEVSALNLNDNCLDIEVVPTASGVQATARPQTTAVTLDVKAAITQAKKEHQVAYVRDQDGHTFHVSGKLWAKAPPFEAPVAVHEPALLFVNVLVDRLRESGVALGGKTRLAAAGDPQPAGTPLLVRRSPLPRALTVCNKRSQNLYAECLLKTLGARKGESGSWQGGAKVVERYLHDLGIPDGEFQVRDGSGLSRQNRLSANALVRILEAQAKGPRAQVFSDSLSIAGTDGTLEKRLHRLASGAVFRGKTGTMHGVSSLAGLLELPRGKDGQPEVIALAVVVNGTHGAALARAAQDDAVRMAIKLRETHASK